MDNKMNNMEDIDKLIKMLDDMAEGGISRIKVATSDEIKEGEAKKEYHHGRCDVGSPFAKGELFDLEEPGCK